jgi:hypothetical protein
MRNQRSSAYIKSQGNNRVATAIGIGWLRFLAKTYPAKRSALLAVPTKAKLAEILKGILAPEGIKHLSKYEQVTLGNLTLRLMTLRNSPSHWNGSVLAAHASLRLLNAVDDIEGVEEVLVIPHTMAEIAPWIQRWQATVFDPNDILPTPNLLSLANPAVTEALTRLTDQVNLITGITHSMDRQAAHDCFVQLRKRGIAYIPAHVENWLITRGGWKCADAAAVGRVAAKILRRKVQRPSKRKASYFGMRRPVRRQAAGANGGKSGSVLESPIPAIARDSGPQSEHQNSQATCASEYQALEETPAPEMGPVESGLVLADAG